MTVPPPPPGFPLPRAPCPDRVRNYLRAEGISVVGRLVVSGSNGAGKSTLLDVLTGHLSVGAVTRLTRQLLRDTAH